MRALLHPAIQVGILRLRGSFLASPLRMTDYSRVLNSLLAADRNSTTIESNSSATPLALIG
jgi:hypothetical protein